MPTCRRARVRFLTMHVHKSGDQMGTTAEWEVNMHAGAESAQLRFPGIRSDAVETLGRDLIVDMTQSGDELRIFMSGKETDTFSPDDPLPTAEHTITPIDNWKNGQRFTLRPSTNTDDYDYTVDCEIACIDAGGGQALRSIPLARTQINWRWCRKCQGIWYAGWPHEWAARLATSNCPVGGFHTYRGSGNYALIIGTPNVDGRQDGWRWCRKCQGLFYGRNHPNQTGVCPQGGGHDSTRSGLYSLVHNTPNHPGQKDWRFCHKCEGLFFSRSVQGVCPAGGNHDASRSGTYTVLDSSD